MEKLNLKQKLVEIRKSIGYLQKTESGNQGAKYVDPAVLLAKIREGMDEYCVLLSCSIVSHEITQYTAPTTKNPNNIGFIASGQTVYTWIDAESDEVLECPWYATGSHLSDPSMAFGGGLTFTERYFLLKFFQVPTSKDDPESITAKAGLIPCVTEEQIANINALIEETKADRIRFLAVMGVSKLEEMYSSNYELAISKLEAKRNLAK